MRASATEWYDQGGQPEGGCDVEDVRPDDIADSQIWLPCFRRQQTHRELGERGSDGDHGKADDRWRYAGDLGEGGCRTNERLAATGKQQQPAENQDNSQECVHGSVAVCFHS